MADVAVTVMGNDPGIVPGMPELWQPVARPLRARISSVAATHCRRPAKRDRPCRRAATRIVPNATSSVPHTRIRVGGPLMGPCGPRVPGATSELLVVVHMNVTCVIAAVPSAAGRNPVVPPVKPVAELAKLHVVRLGNPDAENCTLAGNAVFAVFGVFVSVVLAPPPAITEDDDGLSESMKSVPTPKGWLLLGPPVVVTDRF